MCAELWGLRYEPSPARCRTTSPPGSGRRGKPTAIDAGRSCRSRNTDADRSGQSCARSTHTSSRRIGAFLTPSPPGPESDRLSPSPLWAFQEVPVFRDVNAAAVGSESSFLRCTARSPAEVNHCNGNFDREFVCRNVCRSVPADGTKYGARVPMPEHRTRGPHRPPRLFSPQLDGADHHKSSGGVTDHPRQGT